MRVVIVGRAPDRQRLREALTAAGFEVIGEAASVEEASASRWSADAMVVAPESDASADSHGSDDDPDDPALEHLSPRELEVLNLVALGLSNRGIAGRLDISDQTVKFHVASIIAKLGASNRTDAVRRAVRRGLIDL